MSKADARLYVLQVNAHPYDEYDDDMQDSDKFIPPPKLTSAPASIVPFAQAPSSMGAALGAHSAHSTPTPQGSDLGRLSSKDTSFRSQGSGYSSEPAREGDAHPETLPHMFNKDWELKLDALEVSTLLFHCAPAQPRPLFPPQPAHSTSKSLV